MTLMGFGSTWVCTKSELLGKTSEDTSADFDFPNLPPVLDATHQVSEGYIVERVISWGDPIFQEQSDFDWQNLSGAEQARRFGYNNDFLALLEHEGHWLLTVNHESTSAQLMFEGEERYTSTKPDTHPLKWRRTVYP